MPSHRTGQYGNVTDTTDGSGNITIAHGMENAPSCVLVAARGDNAYIAKVQAVDADDITVLVQDAAGADVTATEVTVDWMAR